MSRTTGSTFKSGFLVAVSIASVCLSVALAGCGSSSGSDSPDAGPTTCDLNAVNAIFIPKCATSGCHDSSGSAAKLDMASAGLATRLLNVAPPGGGVLGFESMCTGMNKIYLNMGSNPATGLFIDKLSSTPGCGVQMPLTGAKLTPAQLACVKSWATSVTSPP